MLALALAANEMLDGALRNNASNAAPGLPMLPAATMPGTAPPTRRGGPYSTPLTWL
jgi:hypothetical protein